MLADYFTKTLREMLFKRFCDLIIDLPISNPNVTSDANVDPRSVFGHDPGKVLYTKTSIQQQEPLSKRMQPPSITGLSNITQHIIE